METTVSARTEAEALVKWKNSLSMPSPSSLESWLVSNLRNLCNWTCIVCNGGGMVSEINLPNTDLSGALLDHLNFTSFPCLNRFNIRGNNLRGNQLEGTLPRALIKCKRLDVLDLGHNNFSDTFPMWLGALPNLKVLTLRFNRFYGAITSTGVKGHFFSQLHVFDLSYNEFTGDLPTKLFKNYKAMKSADEDRIPQQIYMTRSYYYKDSLMVEIKGQERELVRILILFTTIDLSSNKFEGHILDSIRDLLALRELNLSHNKFTGTSQRLLVIYLCLNP